jgi:hypothetical protein
MKRFLNVGGGSKEIPVPDYYRDWQHDLADADPESGADQPVEPRELTKLPAGIYDATYCAHVLERYYPHDGRRVIAGIKHVLKPDGFAEIRTVNLAAVMKEAAAKNLELSDPLMQTDAGAVTVRDLIYGYQDDLEEIGDDNFVHRTGFSPQTLASLLSDAGFARVIVAGYGLNLLAYAFRQEPNAEQKKLLNLPA